MRLLTLALLLPASALAGELVVEPWTPPASVGNGRCMALPGVDRGGAETFAQAALVSGTVDEDAVLTVDLQPSVTTEWLIGGGASGAVLVLCPVEDPDPEREWWVLVDRPAWNPEEYNDVVHAGDSAWRGFPTPVRTTPFVAPRRPDFEITRLRHDQYLPDGDAALGDLVAYSVRFHDYEDDGSWFHLVETDAEGVPSAAPELDATGAGWREALRGTDAVRESAVAPRVNLRPRVEGFFTASSYEERCWRAVVEAPDLRWSEPSRVRCAEPEARPAEEAAGCGGVPAAALLFLVPVTRRRMR